MDESQLCQIYIPATVAGTLPPRAYYPCNLNGRYSAKLVGVTWADQTISTDNRLIQIKSDSFRMMYGSFSNILSFCNKSNQSMSHIQGEFPIMLEAIGNSIDLEFASNVAYDGTALSSFQFCILSFIVKKLE
jgi:hypothetical protein